MQMLINQTYNLTHVKYQQRYDGLDRMFFGFSSFNFTMSGDHYLNVDNYNISFVASLYNTNSMLNYMQYNMLFMARRVCSSSLTYYDQLTYACVSSCPTSSFINSGYSLCVLCSFKCQSCTVNLPDSCLQCNATCNRQGPTSNTCTCKSGFVENNEAICPTCDTFLPGCTNCISKTVCTACKSPYTLDNSTSTCVCKPTYYLVNNVYCLKFPGCTQASFMTTGV